MDRRLMITIIVIIAASIILAGVRAYLNKQKGEDEELIAEAKSLMDKIDKAA